MSRRWVVLLLFALPAPVAAQEEEACEPLRPSGLRAVAGRLGLDDAQEAWLLGELARGRLRTPADLARMPAAGGYLRDRVEAALCWSGGATAAGSAAARSRPGTSLREARFEAELPTVRVRGRARTRTGEDDLWRAGAVARSGVWHGAAGHLRARWGRGLLLASPGAGVRGDAPVRSGPGEWRPALGVDEDTRRGLAVGRRTAALHAWMAHVRGPDGSATWAAVRRVFPGGSVGVLAGGPGATGVSVAGELRGGASVLHGEWARAAGVSSYGVGWRGGRDAWRASVGVERRGGPSPAWGDAVPRSSFRAEVRHRPGRGRFVRAAASLRRDADDPGASARLEGEVGERLARGVAVSLLWRRQSPADGADPVRTVRLDAEAGRLGWRVRVRLQERAERDGRAPSVHLRVGRRARHAWELRASLVGVAGLDPGTWVYRRRAADLHGWDRLGPGVWLGGWARLALGPLRAEASVDGRRDGWEATLGLRAAGGGLGH